MKLLVAWDDPQEADLIQMYLTASGNDVVLTSDVDNLLSHARGGAGWDALLMPASFPDWDRGYDLFMQVRERLPDCPVIGACQSQDLFRIARFLMQGMRSYILRDQGQDFVFLLQVTIESVVHAVQAERERKLAERLREEVDSVRKLQESIIPQVIRPPEGYSICARYEPAQIRILGGQPVVMAGGDYYNVLTTGGSDDAILLVGDASGHGMKACMSVMTMHTLVRMIRTSDHRNTAAFVAEVNQMLCEQSIVTGDGGFITLLYGTLLAERNELIWTSAGHPPPLLHDLETNTVTLLGNDDDGGLPLGIVNDATYVQCVSSIPRHSRVLFYTDGLLEAFSDNGNGHCEFGLEGTIETLRRCRQRPLAEAMQELFDASLAFTDGAGRHDDTSVLLVERF